MRVFAPKLASTSDSESRAFPTKLTISTPGNRYEQEADRAAVEVMRTPGPGAVNVRERFESSPLQPGGEWKTQRHANGKGGENDEDLNGHVEAELDSLHGKGSQLPAPQLAFFERRFGESFADVRIHADAQAASLARSVDARAFTVGRNIVFGAGEYAPESDEGQHLLAHELTHAVQQSHGPAQIQRLTITQHSFTKGTCGERNIQWVFSLDNKAPANGYIVQHINWNRSVKNCPDVMIGPPSPYQNYWEAWFVKKDEKVDWTTTRDKWTDGNSYGPSPGTNGSDIATGTVKFFKASTTGDLGDFGKAPADPKSAWGPGKVPGSGGLPSTPTEPAWWSGAPDEGPAERGVWSWWNCCDPDKNKYTFDLIAKPKP